MASLSPDPAGPGDPPARPGPPGPVPAELAAACAEVRPAGDDDRIGGVPARFVAEPASTAEAAAVLRAAEALSLSVVPRGGGSRLSWGCAPRSCDLILSTRRLDRVLEHAAGDLVVSVQAGTRLGALQDRLAAEGQRLALDPPGGATVGGLIATNVTGPLRFRYGAPRDLLIGITVVRADGTVARAGGKVVKNVAGYDLGKLFAGSYGTLGLITEATFRLHPLPAACASITAETDDPGTAAALVLSAASSPLAPAAIELDWPATAGPLTVSVLLEGDELSVTERAELMNARLLSERAGIAVGPFRLGRPRPGELAPPGTHTHIRVAFWASQLADILGCIYATAAERRLDPAVGGAAAAGVLEVRLPADVPVAELADFVAALRAELAELSVAAGGLPASRASAVVLDAPAEARGAVDMWGPVPSLDLMRAVKDQFDPGHRMAPGRFAGGI
jgi:glycolate oxidase FAD binding subunit